MAEERLKIAVFIDFDNIQIGVKDTLGKDFDVSIVLEALKERGEVVSKIAYGDWPRAGEYSRLMTQHAVQMVQRSVTPRGDKNGADINLALDALEMAFTRDHINTFVIVGGDSDFIALVEKLKQYDKRVFVVGGRMFTSGILQRNCHEFISYENLLKAGGDGSRAARSQRGGGRSAEARALATAMPNLQRALQILAEREVAPQLGLLKSTLLQLDPTFSERDFGAGSFLEFIQKLRKAGLVEMRRTEQGYLVDVVEVEGARESAPEPATEALAEAEPAAEASPSEAPAPPSTAPEAPSAPPTSQEDTLSLLRQALPSQFEKAPNRPLYLRQIRQILRTAGSTLDERAGFRGLLDLLHQAQREGLVRLHRDRKGVWRVFPAVAPPAAPLAPAQAETAPPETLEPELLPVETDVNWEAMELAQEAPEEIREETLAEIPEEISVSEEVSARAEPPPPAPVEEPAPVEAAPEPKPRRTRAARAGAKTATRKTSSRRKPKVPAHGSE